MVDPFAISVQKNYALWQGYKGADENFLNKFNRTRYSVPRTSNDLGEEVFWAPFVWSEYKFDQNGN